MKKFSMLLVLGAICLSLLAVGCGGSSGDGDAVGAAIGGGASKAPIANGNVYVNGVFVTTTDASGNFSLSGLGYAQSDYPLTIEIRGGTSNLKAYADDTVVLDGYLYYGDSTIYLSTLSMMEKRWVDGGMTREEAQARVATVFNAIANIVGFDVGSVDASSNPTASDAFEVVQQALLSFLGVDESSATDIGSALATALDTELTGSTTATDFNNALAELVTTVVQNREAIIQAAANARGTTLSLDVSQIDDALLGLNVWHTQNSNSTVAQDGTIFVDVGDSGNLDLEFLLSANATGGDDGIYKGGTFKLTASSSTIVPVTTYTVYMGTLPTMDDMTITLNGASTITAASTNVNGGYVRLRFARDSMTAAEILAAQSAPLTVTFYAEDNTAISQTFTIRFYDGNSQSTIDSVTMAASNLPAATFNFGASDAPLFINAGDETTTAIATTDLTATISYTGADNLDGVFLRFLAPAGFKFNRSGWSTPYRNLDIYDVSITNAAGNTTVQTGASTAIAGTGTYSLVADSTAQPVGKKSFTCEVKDTSTNLVLASDSKDAYFTTTDSLSHITSMTLDSFNGTSDEVTYTVTGGAAASYGPDLPNFVGTVTTWGTLTSQHADCSIAASGVAANARDDAATSNWKLRLWAFNADADAGFSADSGSTWSRELSVVAAGSAAETGAAVTVANDCTLTVNPGANSMFQPYYVSGRFNRDNVSAVFFYDDATSSDNDYTVTSEPLTFKAP